MLIVFSIARNYQNVISNHHNKELLIVDIFKNLPTTQIYNEDINLRKGDYKTC